MRKIFDTKKIKRSLFRILLFNIMMLHYLSAQQEINAEDLFKLSFEELMNVTVSGVSKYEQDIAEAPATVIVITEKQILNRGYEDLSDILKDLPDVDIVNNARGFGEYYSIRGIEGNDRFLVLIDGQKINPVCATFLSVGNSISIRFARRVEIVYGPGSVMYGADAFSGIINIVSKEIPEDFKLQAHAAYGSYNTIDGMLELNWRPADELAITGMIRLFQSDGPDFMGRDSIYEIVNNYHPPQRNQFEQPVMDHTAFFKLEYSDFTLSYFRQHFDEGNSLGLHPKSYIFNKDARWKMTTNLLWAVYRKEVIKNGSFTAQLAYVNHAQDPETRFYKWVKSYIPDESYSQYMTGTDNTIRTNITYEQKFSANLRFIAGLEYEYTRSIPPYANDQILGEPLKYEGNNAVEIDANLTLDDKRFAGFGQITYKLLNWVDIIAGGRYDYFTRYYGTLNPRAGLILHPGGSTTIKYLYGTAFQAPSLFYQYEQWGSPTAVMLSVDEIKSSEPEWDLKNQKVQTHELSVLHTIGKNVRIQVSGYHNVLQDLIQRSIYTDQAYNKYFSQPDSAVFSTGIRNENIGSQKMTGISIKVTANIWENAAGHFYYSYTDAFSEYNGKTEDIPRIAKHKIWAGMHLRNLFKYFSVSARLKWIGDINNRNSAVYPGGKQPGYTNLDMTITLNNLVKHLRVVARLENVLNSEYDHGGLYDQVFYLPSIPQPKFNLRIGIELKL